MNTEQKLDYMLNCIKKDINPNPIILELGADELNKTTSYFDLLLEEKLIVKKVHEIKDPMKHSKYIITPKGEIFNGFEANRRQQRIIKWNESILNIFLIITGMYYLLEVLMLFKNFITNHICQ